MPTPDRVDDDGLGLEVEHVEGQKAPALQGHPLIGHRAMSAYAKARGYPVSVSTLQKRCSPALRTGPLIVAYYGRAPVTTEELMDKWLSGGLRFVGEGRR